MRKVVSQKYQLSKKKKKEERKQEKIGNNLQASCHVPYVEHGSDLLVGGG